MANKYWVGGGASANWNATGNTNWSDTDGGGNNATIPTTGDDVFFKSSANCTVSADTMTASGYLGSFNMTGYTGTMTNTSYLIRIGGVVGQTKAVVLDGTVNFGQTAGLHLYPQASTNNLTLKTNGKKISYFYIYGAGGTTATIQLLDDLNFGPYTTNFFYYAYVCPSVVLDMNGYDIIGDTVVNRLLIYSGNFGLARTFNINGVITNADFKDITFSGNKTISSVADNGSGKARFLTAGAHLLAVGDIIVIAGTTNYNGSATVTTVSDSTHFDVSALSYVSSQAGTWTHDMTQGGTVLAGDCGRNTGATFTTASTQNATVAGTKNWSDATIWTSRAPLPQDSATATGWSTGTLTVDIPRMGKNIDFSGATAGRTLTLTTTTTNYGSLDTTGISTISGSYLFNFEGRTTDMPAGGWTVKQGSGSFPSTIQFFMGTFSLQSHIVALNHLFLENTATLTTNNYNITLSGSINYYTNTAVTYNLGSSTITAIYWMPPPSATMNAGTSTIISTSTTGAYEFRGGGKTYHNVVFNAGTGTARITYSNTFNKLKIIAPKRIEITNATIQTVNQFVVTGGDGTATRSSSNPATYIDGNGLVQLITANTARPYLGYYDTTGFHTAVGTIIEPLATNYVKQSMFGVAIGGEGDTTQWYKRWEVYAPTITDTDSTLIAISGAKDRKVEYTFTGSEGNYWTALNQITANDSFNATTAIPIALSFWAKGSIAGITTGTATTYFVAVDGLTNLNVDTEAQRINVRLNDASLANLSTTEWRRYRYYGTFATATTRKAYIKIISLQASNKPANGESFWIQITGVQLEQLTEATSHIPTTTASLTRNADKGVILGSLVAGTTTSFVKTGGGFINNKYFGINGINVSPSHTWYYGNRALINSGTGWNRGLKCNFPTFGLD